MLVKGGQTMGFIEVLNPTAEARVQDLPLARRDPNLKGKVIGFLNNRKANAGLLLSHIEEVLHERLGGFQAVYGEKTAASPAPEEVMAALSRCDVVITAIGD